MTSLLTRTSWCIPLLASLIAPAALAESSAPKLSIGGYIQSQYEEHAESEDELSQSGDELNLDRFLIRRARLRVAADTEYAGAYLELNGSTSGGSLGVDLHRAEGRLHYRPEGEDNAFAQLTLGLTKIPFGYELVESSAERLFMERALVIRSLFPGTTDIGAVVSGGYKWFNLSLALMNGEPKGGAVQFAGTDPNGAKDLVIRVGADSARMGSESPLRISGNVSVLTGKGFSPGQPATKARIEWTDVNEDGVVQPFEMTPVPGRAATQSQDFDRWAFGADLQLEYRTGLGATRLEGEIILAQNMDRNLFATDPTQTGFDTRQFGYYAGIIQELGKYAVVGFRYDYYDPNANSLDTRRGRIVPASMTVQTFSPVVGLVLPDVARLTFQYDFVQDHLARDERGIPADLANDAWTLRLQVKM